MGAECAVTPPVARLPRDFHTAWAKTRLPHCENIGAEYSPVTSKTSGGPARTTGRTPGQHKRTIVRAGAIALAKALGISLYRIKLPGLT
jgi:hypothetical protein